jgi:BirA family biotin operon repressor/biotin-[acetyl-CoA-carboxylase] ligase
LVSGKGFRVIEAEARPQVGVQQAPTVSDSPQLPSQYELVQLAQVDSVMEEAANRARDGAEEGTLIWALEQRDARTRRGDRWYSPPGNLYCCLILRPDVGVDRCGQLAYVAALSVGSALAGLLSPMTGLRYGWPNDVFINDLRAGQIMLAASAAHSDPYEWLTLGVMINVEQHPPNPEPEEYNSVHASGAPQVTAVQVLEDFTRYFLTWINRWAEGGFEPILRQWQIRADCAGEEMELRMGDQRLRGRIVEVDKLGRLIIATPEQVEHRISINEYFALDGK